MGQQSISVKHNIEVAHRLWQTPGSCQAIHGHSMYVTMTLYGAVDNTGKLAGLDFGPVKKEFRTHLDGEYDHRLLLNGDDPWAQPTDISCNCYPHEQGETLPGLRVCDGDPTTENIAKWIGARYSTAYILYPEIGGVDRVHVRVQETHVNFACWDSA